MRPVVSLPYDTKAVIEETVVLGETCTVKYLEKDSDEDSTNNTVLHDEKVIGGKKLKDKIEENAIDIPGYVIVGSTNQTIEIGENENEIVFYYEKRTDLNYTVKYLEKDSDEDDSNNVILHEPKVVNGQTYKETVTESAIDIPGYNKIEPNDKSIEIGLNENEIVFYYEKKTDLSYTVKYLEKDTDIEIDKKVVNGKTFKETVTEHAIDIPGYNKVEPTEKSIEIADKRK